LKHSVVSATCSTV